MVKLIRVRTRVVTLPRGAWSQLRAMRCSSWRTYQLATPGPPCPDPMRSPLAEPGDPPAAPPIPGRAWPGIVPGAGSVLYSGRGGAGASPDSFLASWLGSSNFGSSTAFFGAARGGALRSTAWGAGVRGGATFPAPPVSSPLRDTGKLDPEPSTPPSPASSSSPGWHSVEPTATTASRST